jgi:hypothetical protein
MGHPAEPMLIIQTFQFLFIIWERIYWILSVWEEET